MKSITTVLLAIDIVRLFGKNIDDMNSGRDVKGLDFPDTQPNWLFFLAGTGKPIMRKKLITRTYFDIYFIIITRYLNSSSDANSSCSEHDNGYRSFPTPKYHSNFNFLGKQWPSTIRIRTLLNHNLKPRRANLFSSTITPLSAVFPSIATPVFGYASCPPLA